MDATLTRRTVERFFAAVVDEDPAALASVLSEEARVVEQPRGAEVAALPFWHARLARLDYRVLAERMLYRPTEVTSYRGEAALAAGVTRGQLGIDLPPDVVLIHVPITTPRVGTAELFGDELWFVLKASEDGYRIAWIVERQDTP